MRRTLTMALLVACGTAAQAATWVSVGKSGDGRTEWLIDTSTIRTSTATRRAWVKTVFAPQSRQDQVLHSGKWLAFTIERDVFNCRDETVGIESITQYYEGGGNDSMPPDSKSAPMEPVAPDTAQAAELKFICSAAISAH